MTSIVFPIAPVLRFAGAAGLGAIALVVAAVAVAREPTESFADLVERLTPAVVNISTTADVENSHSGMDAFPDGSPLEKFFDFFGQPMPPGDGNGFGGGAHQVTSLGSGFIIDGGGFVVTNNHVIEGASEVTVILDDDTQLAAEVLGRDVKTDLALLKVESETPLPFVEFGDSSNARVGDWVIAIGNPFGLGNTVTAGIISARGRDINAGPYDDFIQTDAPINRGNSGGPMFDMDGKVIGVNTLIFSPSGGSVGVGFATPASLAESIILQLREFGETRRGWLGVRIQTVSQEIAENLGMAEAAGALVASVTAAGPAEAARIEAGDVILRFDGTPVAKRRDLPRIVADTPVGKRVEVVVWRDGQEQSIEVEIGWLDETDAVAAVTPQTPAPAPAPPAGDIEAFGLVLAEITPELRARFGLAAAALGVVVVERSADNESNDFQPGDVIVAIGDQPIETADDVLAAFEILTAAGAGSVVVLRERAGNRRFVALDLETG